MGAGECARVVVVGELNDEFVFDLIQIHFDVVTTHLLLPPVLKVKVLVLPEFPTTLLVLLAGACRLLGHLAVGWQAAERRREHRCFTSGKQTARCCIDLLEPGFKPLVK